MMRAFELLLGLYPADFRAEFGGEMRAVFLALAQRRRSGSWLRAVWFLWTEYLGLVHGAAYERGRRLCRLAAQSSRISASIVAGAAFASAMHLLMYYVLLPHKGQGVAGKGVARILEHLASRVFIFCLLVGMASAQPARQDPAVLETARSIYQSAFTALREAKTLDDLRKVSDNLDSPEWISVDWFGRTILTRREANKEAADRELQSLLALPPERRVTAMEIVWAGRDADRIVVVAWMGPDEAQRVDSEGDYGLKGDTHRLTRGTLIRDVFASTDSGWRRIRHDKILPNDTVLAVDGTPRIVPPLDERYRVTPVK